MKTGRGLLKTGSELIFKLAKSFLKTGEAFCVVQAGRVFLLKQTEDFLKTGR